jgi:hypothetical protein
MFKQLSLILCALAVTCNSYAGVFPTGNTPNTSVTATVTGKVPYSGAVSGALAKRLNGSWYCN